MKRTPSNTHPAIIILMLIIGLISSSRPVRGASFVVNTDRDEPDLDPTDGECLTASDDCTLRAAITEANNNPGSTISFEIETGIILDVKIPIDSALPPITAPTLIQGPNSSGAPIILNGQGYNFNGLVIQSQAANGSQIRNLRIQNFGQNGIYIDGVSSAVIAGNLVGTVNTLLAGNGVHGIFIKNSSGVVIGGTTIAERNCISGNNQHGIYIEGGEENLIQGNHIGVDCSGTLPHANGSCGVAIQSSGDNQIGGAVEGAQNIIASNTGSGICLSSSLTTGTIIQNNYIGVNSTENPLPNGGSGIELTDAQTSLIGGSEPLAGNSIAHNQSNGITVLGTAAGNQILVNSIYDNDNLGIALAVDALDFYIPAANDEGDGDTGPNGMQNYPILTSVLFETETVTILGELSSLPDANYTLHFYGNAACDPSEHGEGMVYLGATIITTSPSPKPFEVTLSTTLEFEFITATATDTFGNTSEFSSCVSPKTFYDYYFPCIIH